LYRTSRKNVKKCAEEPHETSPSLLRNENAIETTKIWSFRALASFGNAPRVARKFAPVSSILRERHQSSPQNKRCADAKKPTRVGPSQRLLEEVSVLGCPHRCGDAKRPQESDHHSVWLTKCRSGAVHTAGETEEDQKGRSTTAFN